MEEILASIRRIIADDDAGRRSERATGVPIGPGAPQAREAVTQPAAPPRPSFSALPEPNVPEINAEATAAPAATSGAEEDQSSEILDLTESMTARLFGQPEPVPAPSPAPEPMPQFQESDSAPQFQVPDPMSQLQEPDEAPQFQEPPAPQIQEPDPVPQIQEPEPAPQSQEPGPTPQFHMPENYPDVSVEEAAEQPAMPLPSEQSAPYVAPETEQWAVGERSVGERGQLLSSATSAAVDSAFNALAHSVLVQNARTLEDLVREMLRPMLKTWLDDNLPGMVERLVRAEIERVARGR